MYWYCAREQLWLRFKNVKLALLSRNINKSPGWFIFLFFFQRHRWYNVSFAASVTEKPFWQETLLSLENKGQELSQEQIPFLNIWEYLQISQSFMTLCLYHWKYSHVRKMNWSNVMMITACVLQILCRSWWIDNRYWQGVMAEGLQSRWTGRPVLSNNINEI